MPLPERKRRHLPPKDRDALVRAADRGRAEGLREALVLVGLGVGIGLARALKPSRPKCVLGGCRLDKDHAGLCQPEGK